MNAVETKNVSPVTLLRFMPFLMLDPRTNIMLIIPEGRAKVLLQLLPLLLTDPKGYLTIVGVCVRCALIDEREEKK